MKTEMRDAATWELVLYALDCPDLSVGDKWIHTANEVTVVYTIQAKLGVTECGSGGQRDIKVMYLVTED